MSTHIIKNNEGVVHLPNLDGVEIQPGVTIIGEVYPIPGTNLLRALANVAGVLCLVELRVCFKEVVEKKIEMKSEGSGFGLTVISTTTES